MRIAVVGCGSIGRRHLRNLQVLRGMDLVGVDVRSDRRQTAEKDLGIPTAATLSEAFAGGLDAVFVTSPPSTHVSIALEAVQSGCHVFIEKPLSHTLEGIDNLMREVEARNLTAFVGSNWKFHPSFQRMKMLLEKGAIGRVTSARCQFGQYLPDWHPWEDYRQGYSARRNKGGGVILDAIHEIDYLRWLIGEVEEVASFAGKLTGLEIDTEDTAAILVRFANGTIGELHMDYVQRSYSRTCHIIGEKGTIRWDYTSGEVRAYSPATRDWRSFANPNGWEPNQMYIDELKSFIDATLGTGRFCNTLAEDHAVLKLLYAIEAADRAGSAQPVST